MSLNHNLGRCAPKLLRGFKSMETTTLLSVYCAMTNHSTFRETPGWRIAGAMYFSHMVLCVNVVIILDVH